MKLTYEIPQIEVIEFAPNDVITTSGGGAAILPDDEF